MTSWVTQHSERGSVFQSRKFLEFPSMKEALISREIQATFMVAPLAMKLAADGVPVKIVYLGHRDGTVLMVHKDGPVRDFGGLRGKRVAIPTRFSNQHLLMLRMMKQWNMEKGSIEFLEMAPPDMPAALQAKAIDGYIVGEPHAARAELGGWGRPLYFTKDIWPNFISCVLVVRQELIDEQRDVVEELVGGIAASGKWLDEDVDQGAEHRMKAADIAGRAFYNQDPELLKFVLSKPLDRVRYTELTPMKPAFDEIMDLAVEAGLIQRRMAFEEYVDDSFARAAHHDPLPFDTMPVPAAGAAAK